LTPTLAGFQDMQQKHEEPTFLDELLEAHDRFPALFDEQRAGMVLFDLTGSLVRANRAALGFLGASLGDLGGYRYATFMPGTDTERGRLAFARALAGDTTELTARLPVAGHDTMDVPLTLSPALVGRKVVGVYCSAKLMARTASRKLQELTSLYANTANVIIAFDENGRCVDANPACERLTGYAASHWRGRHYPSFFAPRARQSARDTFARVMLGESVPTESVLVARGDNRVVVAGTSVPIVVDEAVVGAHMILRDVTVDRKVAATLRERAEAMRELYLIAASNDETVEAQIAATISLGCKHLNCGAGYVTRTAGGSVTYFYSTGDVRHIANEAVSESMHGCVLAHGETFAGEAPDDSGTRAFVGTPIELGGVLVGALCLFCAGPRAGGFSASDRDFVELLGALVSSALERDERRRRAELLAFHDPLTGLANRTLLGDRLEQAIASAKRHRTVFALHFYDLDNFKQINDARGHMRGDDVLRAVAQRFQSVARSEDTVARIGGDEFVVLQPGVQSRADAESLAKRLRSVLAETLSIGGTDYRIAASAGIALFPDDAKEPETLLARADSALYRVKQHGRDGIAFYGDK